MIDPEQVTRKGMIAGAEAERLLPALGQRERATLGSLAACGRIGSAELIAANRWTRLYLAAVQGVFERERATASTGPRLLAAEALVAVTAQNRKACAALGTAGTRRMVLLLAEGRSMANLAAEIGRNPAVASGMVEADLCRLAEHYTETDAARKQLH